eukprot:TRINITY_DN909_c2_g1_i3.p1 TRINITY_DN909_c2_g1~~TRINITY_DN909_c2_g1_i3.p1  ORF type:complete len:809 (+),score=182.20 TRINITY_DN909_c2_g1_i3:63-2429(+)
MDEYTLADLHRLAQEYGVRLGNSTREEAVALLSSVHDAAGARGAAGEAVVVGSLAVAVAVCKAYSLNDPEGYYAALQLPLNATESEIKTAHKQRSMILHEDRHATAPKELHDMAKEMQQRVNTAKEVLLDSATRRAYHHQGSAGVARASLVPAHLGAKDFISNLDILAQKEKLVRLQQELDSSGSAVVRFDCSDNFQRITEGIHAGLDSIGYDWDKQPEQYEEEYEEDEEEEEIDLGEEREEDSEEGGEDSNVMIEKSKSLRVARVDINGRQMFVIIPDDDVQQKLEANLQQQMEKRQTDGDEGVEHDHPTPPMSKTKKMIQTVMNWPRMLPHASQVFMAQSFSYPILPKHLLEFSAGGPQSWFKTVYTYSKCAMSEYKAKAKMQASALTVHVQMLRKMTANFDWTLRYKVVSSLRSSSWGSALTSIFRRTIGEGRDLTAKLHISPDEDDRKLTWIYSKWDEMSSTSYSLDLGYLTLGGTVINRLMLPRKDPVLVETLEDEDEEEAVRTAGNLTTMYSQDIFEGTTRISWKAMFNLSKKSTANQLGFGISTSLPYCFLGFAWATSPEYHARTELQLVFKRNKFSIAAPILITTATDGPTTATYLLAPILLFKLAQELLIKPWSGMRKRKEIMQRRVMHRDKQWGEHRRALDEQKLLEIEAKRRLNEELATEGGLVIQNAKYGCLHPNFTYDEEDLPPNVLDVSVCLQAKVANHGLILPAGPKHQYDGFCNVDPHGEEEKYIKVRYLFHDQPHEVEVLENMELALPLLEHKIDLKSAAHEAVSPKNTSR